MKQRVILVFLMFCVIQVNWAQIKVLQSAGGSSIENSTAKTRIVFELLDSETRDKVSIYEILSESRVYASGSGGTASGSAQTQRLICYAPGVIELNAGMYRFGITGNPMLDKKFDIFADGGEQVWGVSYGKPFRSIMGIMMGTTGLIMGTMLTGLGISNSNDEDYSLDSDPGAQIGWGLVTTAASGLWLWDGIRTYPKARLLSN